MDLSQNENLKSISILYHFFKKSKMKSDKVWFSFSPKSLTKDGMMCSQGNKRR